MGQTIRAGGISCRQFCRNPENVEKAVIYVLGYGDDLSNEALAAFGRKVEEECENVLLIAPELPAHGEHQGELLTLSACDGCLKSVLAYVREHYPKVEILGHGTSFGSYLMLKYIRENGNPFRRQVLRCPAISMRDVLLNGIMTEENLKELEAGKQTAVGFANKIMVDRAFLDELQENDVFRWDYRKDAASMMIIQGNEDEVIPFSAVQNFAAKNGIRMEAVSGADHRFLNGNTLETAMHAAMIFLRG